MDTKHQSIGIQVVLTNNGHVSIKLTYYPMFNGVSLS